MDLQIHTRSNIFSQGNFLRLPRLFMSKTIIGNSFSWLSVKAVVSITLSPFFKNIIKRQGIKLYGFFIFFRVFVIDSIYPCSFQNYISIDFYGAKNRRRVGGKVGVSVPDPKITTRPFQDAGSLFF